MIVHDQPAAFLLYNDEGANAFLILELDSVRNGETTKTTWHRHDRIARKLSY